MCVRDPRGPTLALKPPPSALFLATQFHSVSEEWSQARQTHKDVFTDGAVGLHFKSLLSSWPTTSWAFCSHVNETCQNSIVSSCISMGNLPQKETFLLPATLLLYRKIYFCLEWSWWTNLAYSNKCLETVPRQHFPHICHDGRVRRSRVLLSHLPAYFMHFTLLSEEGILAS